MRKSWDGNLFFSKIFADPSISKLRISQIRSEFTLHSNLGSYFDKNHRLKLYQRILRFLEHSTFNFNLRYLWTFLRNQIAVSRFPLRYICEKYFRKSRTVITRRLLYYYPITLKMSFLKRIIICLLSKKECHRGVNFKLWKFKPLLGYLTFDQCWLSNSKSWLEFWI